MFLSSISAKRWNQVWVVFLAVGFIYFGRWFLPSGRWFPLLLAWAVLFVMEHFWWNRHTFRTLLHAAKEYESGNRPLSYRWLGNLLIDLPVAFVTFSGPFIVLETTILGSILSRHLSYMWFNPFPESVRWIAAVTVIGNVLFLILSNVSHPNVS